MPIPEPNLSPDQFLRPLYVIRAEHERQLKIGKELFRLASVRDIDSVIEIGRSLFAFFTEDLLLHHQDEEADLFRILRFICPPEDHIELLRFLSRSGRSSIALSPCLYERKSVRYPSDLSDAEWALIAPATRVI